MNTPRKGGRPSASQNPNSPFSGDGLSRLLAGSQEPAPKLHVGQDQAGNPTLRVEMPVDPKRYTLQRDEDRPLQFDGAALASAESRSGHTTHRVAIYRTRGGKFVTEFSSRPAGAATIYNDPPRLPESNELADYRELFIEAVIEQAEWREGKAEEHPRDIRNHDSAAALRYLASRLDQVPENDTRWICLWLAENNLSDEHPDDDTTITERQLAAKSEILRAYGFYNVRTVTKPDLEVRRFLDEMINGLERAAQPEDVTLPSGKAAVFDSLDDALGWFRPGKLTNELLKKLGRWDPEFIE
jgi:hypothetical protein